MVSPDAGAGIVTRCDVCGKPVSKWELRCGGSITVGDVRMSIKEMTVSSQSVCRECVLKALGEGSIRAGKIMPEEIWEGEDL